MEGLYPRPPEAQNLAEVVESLDLPSRPKPALTYGYNDDAFPDALSLRLLLRKGLKFSIRDRGYHTSVHNGGKAH